MSRRRQRAAKRRAKEQAAAMAQERVGGAVGGQSEVPEPDTTGPRPDGEIQTIVQTGART